MLPSLDILLAEDNVVNQKLAVRLFEKNRHVVTVASNGKEACEAFEHGRFDLILMDVQMPELNGFEATSWIRAREAATSDHIGCWNKCVFSTDCRPRRLIYHYSAQFALSADLRQKKRHNPEKATNGG